ncbi:hypothetical protein Lal_00003592 [Lupinus albus]|nr:hypothetical protein Lal_00003592 [Lupinus albus]
MNNSYIIFNHTRDSHIFNVSKLLSLRVSKHLKHTYSSHISTLEHNSGFGVFMNQPTKPLYSSNTNSKPRVYKRETK